MITDVPTLLRHDFPVVLRSTHRHSRVDRLPAVAPRNTQQPAVVHQSSDVRYAEITGDCFTGRVTNYSSRVYGHTKKIGEGRRENPIPREFVRGCFTHSLAVDGDDIVVCINHDKRKVVCGSDNIFLEEKDEGLFFTIWPETNVSGHRAVLAAMDDKIGGASVSGYIRDSRMIRGVEMIRRFEIMEVSLLIGRQAADKTAFAHFKSSSELAAEQQAKIRDALGAAQDDGWLY